MCVCVYLNEVTADVVIGLCSVCVCVGVCVWGVGGCVCMCVCVGGDIGGSYRIPRQLE